MLEGGYSLINTTLIRVSVGGVGRTPSNHRAEPERGKPTHLKPLPYHCRTMSVDSGMGGD